MELINVGASPNSHDGDSLRLAFQKINSNFSELSTVTSTTPPLTAMGAEGDVAGQLATDEMYLYCCVANYDGSSVIWKRLAWSVDIW